MADKKLKIAFLSFYSGKVYRGVETYVHELANRLADQGHSVTVYQYGDKLINSKYKTVSISIPIDWKRQNTYLSYISFINYYSLKIRSFTLKVLKQIDTDTDIIFPTNGQWQSLHCSIWAKRNKKKIVISGQSGPGIDDRINLWTFPDRFVTLTTHQKKWARRANPLVNLSIIPNGVDLNKFNIKIKPLKIDLPKPIILCVAAFDFWKRLDLAIKAVSKLESGSLLLVGKGFKEKDWTNLGNKLLPGRFKVLNFPHEQMPNVYATADLFTFPTSTWESFGIVLVEAMASGLPVVATQDPIRGEIVGDAGILVDPTNREEYTAALKKALETKWGNKAREQAKKFSWDKIAEEYEKLFLDL